MQIESIHELEMLLITPVLQKTPSAWWGHVPFAFWIMQNMKPSTFVELGTHYGVSYAAFCESVKQNRLNTKCFAVDSWTGDEQSGKYGLDVFLKVKDINNERYSAFSELLWMEFDDAVKNFNNESIDLLHLDGFHSYDAVKHDFEVWSPKLSKKSVVLFHDTNVRKNGFGVWKLFDQLRLQYDAFEFLHGNGLGIICFGDDCSDSIREMCKLKDDADISSIRNFYAYFGSFWINRIESYVTNETMHNSIIELERKLTILQKKDKKTYNCINSLRMQNELLKSEINLIEKKCDDLSSALSAATSELELVVKNSNILKSEISLLEEGRNNLIKDFNKIYKSDIYNMHNFNLLREHIYLLEKKINIV